MAFLCFCLSSHCGQSDMILCLPDPSALSSPWARGQRGEKRLIAQKNILNSLSKIADGLGLSHQILQLMQRSKVRFNVGAWALSIISYFLFLFIPSLLGYDWLTLNCTHLKWKVDQFYIYICLWDHYHNQDNKSIYHSRKFSCVLL